MTIDIYGNGKYYNLVKPQEPDIIDEFGNQWFGYTPEEVNKEVAEAKKKIAERDEADRKRTAELHKNGTKFIKDIVANHTTEDIAAELTGFEDYYYGGEWMAWAVLACKFEGYSLEQFMIEHPPPRSDWFDEYSRDY